MIFFLPNIDCPIYFQNDIVIFFDKSIGNQLTHVIDRCFDFQFYLYITLIKNYIIQALFSRINDNYINK